MSKSICTDLCEHCIYIECGDFICDVTDDVTIVDWKPFPCECPENALNDMIMCVIHDTFGYDNKKLEAMDLRYACMEM